MGKAVALVGHSEVEEVVNLRLKASLARFELATRCLEGSCSVQLSYRDSICTLNLALYAFEVKNLYQDYDYFLIDTALDDG